MYDSDNLKRLGELKALAPNPMACYEALDRAALATGSIPRKFKELMAISVAVATQCPYTLDAHRVSALQAGATETEIAEAVFIAVTITATAALAHGTHVIGGSRRR